MQRKRLEDMNLLDDFLFNAVMTFPGIGERFCRLLLQVVLGREIGRLRVVAQRAFGVNNQSEFYARSQNSFYKKTSNKKDRQKELLEEYLEKRAQVKKQQQEMLNEKIAKQEQERSRLLRSWNNERLLSKASNAYEANAMTEAVTDSAFSLG